MKMVWKYPIGHTSGEIDLIVPSGTEWLDVQVRHGEIILYGIVEVPDGWTPPEKKDPALDIESGLPGAEVKEVEQDEVDEPEMDERTIYIYETGKPIADEESYPTYIGTVVMECGKAFHVFDDQSR